ncbi:hypothetical protein IQ22_04245 [Pseudomonas duriflava]|uniref:Uncharacterized protein n=1 Tax=Pseudomonas duriflava TaxID=459528 RepID=A0A562PUC3_9PSED|nr:hypothetical protein [Pseudomonas duriflava]TWI48052.1 hypothetical protein IQ22_04245 [Pseudomonas duriflava]
MRTYTFTLDQLREFAESLFDDGYRCASTVSEQGDPMDVFRTEAYYHTRCREVEHRLFSVGGKQ